MKKILLALFVVSLTISAHAEENTINEDCEVTYKHYDESHVAYSKEFAKKYSLPEKDIVEMPEYLQFIEMAIRSEFGKPVCYLNFSIEKNPEIFKIPEENFHIKRFTSSIKQHLKRLGPLLNGYDIAKKTMWIELVNLAYTELKNRRNTVLVLPYDLFIVKDSILISTRLTSCSLAYKEIYNKKENGVLQIEKANPEITYDDIRVGGNFIDSKKFYHTFILPEDWYRKTNQTLSEIEKITKAEKKCSHNKLKEQYRLKEKSNNK